MRFIFTDTARSVPTLSSALTCTAIPNYSGFALMIPLPLGIVQTNLTLLSLTRGIIPFGHQLVLTSNFQLHAVVGEVLAEG